MMTFVLAAVALVGVLFVAAAALDGATTEAPPGVVVWHVPTAANVCLDGTCTPYWAGQQSDPIKTEGKRYGRHA
jgi:hypothetical protein